MQPIDYQLLQVINNGSMDDVNRVLSQGPTQYGLSLALYVLSSGNRPDPDVASKLLQAGANSDIAIQLAQDKANSTINEIQRYVKSWS
jgi:hypothetical protein